MNLSDDEIRFLIAFKSVFQGRTNIVAKRWETYNPESQKQVSGYSPICSNLWKPDLCLKKINNKSKCKDCHNINYSNLSDGLLVGHFRGQHVLGVYPLLQNHTCRFIACDLDNHLDKNGKIDFSRDPLANAQSIYAVGDLNNIPCYVLRSRSGSGFHVYLFFDNPAPAWKARLVFFAILREAQVIGEDIQISSFDKLIPSQDELSVNKPLGNLIAYPFQGEAWKSDNTIFLDPDSNFVQPYQDQLAVLGNIQRVTESDLDRIIQDWNLKQNKQIKQPNRNYQELSNDSFNKLLQCDFIRWAYENQEQVTEPLWYAMISNVATIRPGGIDLAHQCSKNHPGYSSSETEMKILNAINNSNPQTCQHIKSLGGKCNKSCGVKSPAGLIYEGSNKTMEVDMQPTIDQITDLAQKNTSDIVLKILNNQQYKGALVSLASNDAAQYQATLMTLEKAGVKVKDVKSLEKAIKGEIKKTTHLRLVQAGEESEQKEITVKSVIQDAPVQDNIIIPNGWLLSKERGIEKLTFKTDPEGNKYPKLTIVSPSPIFIVGRLIGLETGQEIVRLALFKDNRWKFEDQERQVIANAKLITQLAGNGIDVTSLTANSLVEFLSNFESCNIHNLPRARMSNILGWQKDYESFLWGQQLLKPNSAQEQVGDSNDLSPETWKEDMIIFHPLDGGNSQMAKAFCAKGSYEEWVRGVNKVYEYPKAYVSVLFSLAVAFLPVLGAENFSVDWFCRSSKGKTVTLRIGASCWGNPDEKSIPSVLHTWRNTITWIEKYLSRLSGIPMFLDDTKLAGTGNLKDMAGALVSQVLYMIWGAQDKGRANPSANLISKGSFRTILLTNGEQPAVTFTNDGGAKARAITLGGLPFDKADAKTAEFVNEINQIVKNNFGHAGPRVAQFILNEKDKIPLWKETYQEKKMDFLKKAGSDSLAMRLSDYFAFLATVMPLIHKALPELKAPPVNQIMTELWSSLAFNTEEADIGTKALIEANNWAVANEIKFYGRHQINHDGTPKVPLNGWAGVWKKNQWEVISFQTQVLDEILKDRGMNINEVLPIWKDNKWLETGTRGMVKQVRINGNHVYCYQVTRAAIEKVMGAPVAEQQEDFVSKLQEVIYSSLPANLTPQEQNELLTEISNLLLAVHNYKLNVSN